MRHRPPPGWLVAVRTRFCGPDCAAHHRRRCFRLQAPTDPVIQMPCAGKQRPEACSPALLAAGGDTCLWRCRSRHRRRDWFYRHRRELWSAVAMGQGWCRLWIHPGLLNFSGFQILPSVTSGGTQRRIGCIRFQASSRRSCQSYFAVLLPAFEAQLHCIAIGSLKFCMKIIINGSRQKLTARHV